MFVCVCVCVVGQQSKSKGNNTYVGLITSALSRSFTMRFNDSSSISLHYKTHPIPKSKYRKILFENTTMIAHEINKLQLQILEALHLKTKRPRINRIHFENSDNVLKRLLFVF